MSDWLKKYPNRYYAFTRGDYTDKGVVIPALDDYFIEDKVYIITWVDVAMFTTIPSWLPPASKMIALTKDEWDNRQYLNQILYKGKIYTYEPTNTE